MKSVLATIFLTALIGMSSLSFKVQTAQASGTIYIRADGSIDPPTVPISTTDNITYTFTGNINDSIVVERDSIIVGGQGYTITGDGIGNGITLRDRSNVTLKNAAINNFRVGVYLENSLGTVLSGNNVTANNQYGIYLDYAYNNTLSGNNASNNQCGIWLGHSSGNVLYSNNVTANDYYGISLYFSSGNVLSDNNVTANNKYAILGFFSPKNNIFHNSFMNNTNQVLLQVSFNNTWDDGYPSGGNYWGDCAGADYKQGSDQEINGCDGIGDTEYSIDLNNIDRYPLMGMFYGFTVMWQEKTYAVNVISNSTVSGIGYVILTSFQWPNHTITETSFDSIYFYVSGEDGTYGFCRVCIPVALLNTTYRVFVNGTEVPYSLLPCSSSTDSYLYFTYSHSTERVEITPEFPSFLILPLSMLVTLLVATVYKRKQRQLF